MFSALGHCVRLVRVALVLARHDALLPPELLSRLPPAGAFLGRFARGFSGEGKPGTQGEKLAAALEELGPAWIKLGQFLAGRPDVIGAEAAAGLSRLKDKLPPFAQDVALAELKQGFGDDYASLFGALGPAVAAASVAQVHKAALPDGRFVAVKILRPGIEAAIAREGKTLAFAAHWANRLFPATRRLRPIEFVATVMAALTRELDLRLEAGAADEFAENAARDGYMSAPSVDWARCSQRVLTTAWVDGLALTDSKAIEALPIAQREALGISVTRAFLASALDHGFFHADIHEGNLILGADGTLVAVDFGITGRISPAERRYLAEILLGFLQRNYVRIAEMHREAGYVPADRSIGDFAQALRAVGEPIQGKRADEVSMSRLLLQLFDVTEAFGMALRPELVLLQKTMVQVEGVARGLDPRHDLWEAARPIVERWIARELGPEAVARRVASDVSAVIATLRRLPSVLDRIERLSQLPPHRAFPWVWMLGSALLGGLMAVGLTAFAAGWL